MEREGERQRLIFSVYCYHCGYSRREDTRRGLFIGTSSCSICISQPDSRPLGTLWVSFQFWPHLDFQQASFPPLFLPGPRPEPKCKVCIFHLQCSCLPTLPSPPSETPLSPTRPMVIFPTPFKHLISGNVCVHVCVCRGYMIYFIHMRVNDPGQCNWVSFFRGICTSTEINFYNQTTYFWDLEPGRRKEWEGTLIISFLCLCIVWHFFQWRCMIFIIRVSYLK